MGTPKTVRKNVWITEIPKKFTQQYYSSSTSKK